MESLIAPVKHNGPCDNISAPSGTLDHRQKETTMPVTVVLELTLKAGEGRLTELPSLFAAPPVKTRYSTTDV